MKSTHKSFLLLTLLTLSLSSNINAGRGGSGIGGMGGHGGGGGHGFSVGVGAPGNSSSSSGGSGSYKTSCDDLDIFSRGGLVWIMGIIFSGSMWASLLSDCIQSAGCAEHPEKSVTMKAIYTALQNYTRNVDSDSSGQDPCVQCSEQLWIIPSAVFFGITVLGIPFYCNPCGKNLTLKKLFCCEYFPIEDDYVAPLPRNNKDLDLEKGSTENPAVNTEVDTEDKLITASPPLVQRPSWADNARIRFSSLWSAAKTSAINFQNQL